MHTLTSSTCKRLECRALGAFLALGLLIAARADEQPNIIVIVADGLLLDGQSHLPLLLEKPMVRIKSLQWHHYNTNSRNSPNPNAMIRRGNYVICGFYDESAKDRLSRGNWKPAHLQRVQTGKLIRFAIYDIESDPKQQRNLAEAEPERFEKMKAELHAAHAEMQEQAIGWDGATTIGSYEN